MSSILGSLLRIPDSAVEWRSLRRFIILKRGGLVAFAACALPLIVMSSTNVIRAPLFVLAFLGLAAYGIGGFWSNFFQCPRCGELFFERRTGGTVYHNSIARRCVNCGLPRWQPVAESAKQAV